MNNGYSTPRNVVESVYNWSVASFLGIFIPILGLIFGLIGETKAAKLLELEPKNADLRRARKAAKVGLVVSTVSFVLQFYLYLNYIQ